jgi:hypothetical protein
MSQHFKRNFVKRVFQNTVPLKFQVFEKFDKNIYEFSHLKERKILSKMRGCPALHDVSFQSYMQQKNGKNMFLADFQRFFDKYAIF